MLRGRKLTCEVLATIVAHGQTAVNNLAYGGLRPDLESLTDTANR